MLIGLTIASSRAIEPRVGIPVIAGQNEEDVVAALGHGQHFSDGVIKGHLLVQNCSDVIFMRGMIDAGSFDLHQERGIVI